MIKWTLDQIKDRIKQEKGLSEEDLNARIKQKLDQLSGLISKEGAAHIVATELGIKLLEQPGGRVKIKNLLSGMRNVEVLGKTLVIYDIREFDTGKRKGKLGSFLIGDDTGTIRVVLWNDTADQLLKLNKDDVLALKGLYVRDNNGRLEAHSGEGFSIDINPSGEIVNAVISNFSAEAPRKKVSELSPEHLNVELFGTVVESYDPYFFEVCSDCGKRAPDKGEGAICPTHGKVAPNYSYVMNLVLDDGSGNIRCVFFRNQLLNLLNIDENMAISLKGNPESIAAIKHGLLGNVIKVHGKVTNNEQFKRLEFVVQRVFPNPNPQCFCNK